MRGLLFCALLSGWVACSSAPKDTVARIDRFLAEGKLGDAELLCRKMLANKQFQPEMNRRLAQIAMRQGRPSDAFRHIQESLALKPRDEESWNLAGEVLLPAYWEHPSRPPEMRHQLELTATTLLRLNPDSVTGHRIEGYLALDSNRPKAAERFFQKVLAMRPQDEQAAAMLIQVLFALERTGEAVELAKRELARHQGSALIRTTFYRGLMRTGNAEEARQLLTGEVSRKPDDINVRLDLAVHHRRMGESSMAEALIADVHARATTLAGGRMTLALFHRRSGDYSRAAAVLREGEQAEPASAIEYLRELIEIQFESSDLSGARESARRAARLYPGEEDFQVRKHILEAELGGKQELEAATAHMRSLLEKRPGSPIYHMHLGRLLLSGGNRLDANTEFVRAIRLEPGLLEARLLLMRGLMETGEYEQVLAEAETALQINSNLLPARAAKLSALRALGRFAEARTVLRELKESGADPAAAALEEVYILLMEGKPKPAEAMLRSIPPVHRTGVRAVAAMAESLTAQRRWTEAVAFLREDLKLRPGRPIVLFALGKSLAGAGQTDFAKARFEEMLQSQPSSGEALQALAELEVSRGNDEGAITAYRRWIAVQPQNPVALNDLAYLLVKKGTGLPEALAMAKKALQLAPGNPGILDTIGVLHLKMGNVEEAARVLGALSRQAPEIPAVRYHTGQSYRARGDRNAAVQEWEAALRLRPVPELKREIESSLASVRP